MKLSALLLAGSLVINAGLAGLFAFRPAQTQRAFHGFIAQYLHADATVQSPAKSTGKSARNAAAPRPLWTSLQTDDLAALVTRLRAAGFPAAIIRNILIAQLNARYDARLRALQEPDDSTPFWKISSNIYSSAGDPRLLEMNRLQRERASLLRDLLKDDFFATDDISGEQHRRFGNLPGAKIDLLQRIEDDYSEMTSAVRAAMNGVTLPEDREKLALLNREKNADLAAILTPAELADYEMRTSPITAMLRGRLGDFDATEAEFTAIYQAHLAQSAKFPAGFSGGIDDQLLRSSEQEFNTQLRAALGDARFADYARETMTEFQQLSRLGQHENLPSTTTDQAYNLRDAVSLESNRIFDDSTLTADQKRTALQSLAQATRSQINQTLGPVAGPAYVKIADSWLNNVERGAAVKFPTTPPFMILNENGSFGLGNSPTYRRLPPVPPVR